VTVVVWASLGIYRERGGQPKAQRLGSILFTLDEWDSRHGLNDHYPRMRTNIWRMNSDGSDARPLTHINAYGCHSDTAAWSPDGTHIAFNSNCISQDVPPDTKSYNIATWSNVWVMNEDGSHPIPLMKVDKARVNSGPAWSPDSRKIAFDSMQDENNTTVGSDIWVVNSDGSGAVPLTNGTRPAWSPDGSKLAFISNRTLDGSIAPNLNEASNVWVVNADGSGLKPLTRFTEAKKPISVRVWSADSNKVAFAFITDLIDNPEPAAPRNVWVVNVDGSSLKQVTTLKEKFAYAPQGWPWSPDGSKLTVTVKGNIWEMNSDGSGARPPMDVHETWATSSPVWSPDGTQIAFLYNEDPGPTKGHNFLTNIWVTNQNNANGFGAVQLTHCSQRCAIGLIAWRP
jgi:Tol biopolymer transport system component